MRALRVRGFGIDPPLAGCVAWLIVLPLLAGIAAWTEPEVTPANVAVPRAQPEAPAAQVRAVPISELRPEPSARMLADAEEMRRELAAVAREVLGREAGDRLLALVEQTDSLRDAADQAYDPNPRYPYRYPKLDRLLDKHLSSPLTPIEARRANDLGVLLIHAAAMGSPASTDDPLPHAGSAAFAVLHRAAAAGACLPRLNLGFVVAADSIPRPSIAERVLQDAARACPGDPTPLWLLGQLQSLQAAVYTVDPPATADLPSQAEELEPPLSTFRELRRQFPGSSAGWAGAGDANMRIAYQLGTARPFSAQVRFRRALAFYREARRVDPSPEILAGAARAHAGLHQHVRAIAAQRAVIAASGPVAPFQAWFVEYLERAGRFGEAARAAALLDSTRRFPAGQGYYSDASDLFTFYAVDGDQPLSIGAGRFDAVKISLGLFPGGGGDGANDLSFIPDYRDEYWITGHNRWCPGWAEPRNRILAGQPGAAIAPLLRELGDIRPRADVECGYGRELLAGVAAYEHGDAERARELVRAGEDDYSDERLPAARLHDTRQNLWRFAGDLERARDAAADWRRATPHSPLAYDRAGEIEFLAREYEEAERLFARAVSQARAERGLDSVPEAEALVKRGVALARLGRRSQAMGTLEQAEIVASRARGLAEQFSGEEWTDSSVDAGYVHYNALAQLGYTALEAGRYEQAVDAYEAAAAMIGDIYYTPDPEQGGAGRAEVALNNLALAQTKAGDMAGAARASAQAVKRDPRNPFSVGTQGFVQAAMGDETKARRTLASTLRHYPRQYTAWNNLGVLEARAGRSEEAIEAFRRAVGADEDYALGWFNLGVALEGQGPLHAVQSQGALGRAIKADPELAGREHRLSLDRDVYLSELDLSKPLPAGWSFADAGAATGPPAAAGLVVLLIAGLQLGRSLGGQTLSSTARPLLELAHSALAWLGGRQPFVPAAVALAATGFVFLIPLIRSGTATVVQTALLLSGLAALAGIVWRARVLMARREGVELTQRGWRPALVVGVGAGLFGVPWAPLPVAQTNRLSAAVHWVAPVATGAIAIVLLVLTVWLQIPMTRALGVAALVMTASMLIPVEPLDGGMIDKAKSGGVVALALAGTGLALLLQL